MAGKKKKTTRKRTSRAIMRVPRQEIWPGGFRAGQTVQCSANGRTGTVQSAPLNSMEANLVPVFFQSTSSLENYSFNELKLAN